jgi:hypothetical protein
MGGVGLRKRKWREQLWFPPIVNVLNSLKFKKLPKNCPREWRVGFEDFCVRTLVFWSMVSMIMEFACQEGLIKKHCGWCAPSKLIGTHHLAIQISAHIDIVWIFGFDTNDSRNCFGSKGTTRKAEKI